MAKWRVKETLNSSFKGMTGEEVSKKFHDGYGYAVELRFSKEDLEAHDILLDEDETYGFGMHEVETVAEDAKREVADDGGSVEPS